MKKLDDFTLHLTEKNKEVWDEKRFAFVVSSAIGSHTYKKPLSRWEILKRRIAACLCIICGDPMVYYENTKSKYFKENPVIKVEHIIYYDKSKY